MTSAGRCVLCVLVLLCLVAPMSAQQIVVSQVYGGGGNSGATYRNDFIEIFNRGTSAVSLNGLSVQYAATTGTTWQATALTNVTLNPGQYYLIQEAAGAGGTVSLPTPNATGTINMSATAGKVALVNGTALLSGACPTTGVIDFVGFGTGTNCFEGTGPTASLSNTTAALRAGNGCTDTNSNAADFASGAPNPRNTSSTANSCGGSTNPSGTGAALPASVTQGNTTLLTVTVTPGTNPASTGLAVSADLTSIGGSATQAFYDDATHGDVTAGDNIFTFSATVPSNNATGAKSLTATITDAQSRTGSATISLTVNAASTSPTGTGAANPSSLQAGNSTLLTVTVTPGTAPASTGITVTGDLSAIGGSSSQAFYDDGTHGDVTTGDNIFSFSATVAANTSQGTKPLPISIADAQSRTGSASISVTIQPPPPPTTVKISQIYGGGGNSGTTYTNDFIEIFNQGPTAVDITGWSVQHASAGSGTWSMTPLCSSGTCTIQPGRYFLVQESQGLNGTTPLPTPDATGLITMGATSGKDALVASTAVLSGACPTDLAIVDMVGYGSTASCFEGAPTGAPTNLTAVVRRGNGCIDTGNNANDFVVIGPIPRNSASPANSCGGDPANPSGLGIASPSALDPASKVTLSVAVTPASVPPSTGLHVVADLSSIGGDAAQVFYDNGSNGDVAAGDNVFTWQQLIGAHITTGAKSIVATITDSEGRSVTAPITLTVTSPTCGVERWSVKTGTDPDAPFVDLAHPVPGSILLLGLIPPPPDPPGPPLNQRVVPQETTVFTFDATMTLYKLEDDVDYHIVLSDEFGNTLVSEIPSPACVGVSSPFASGIASARAAFDAKLQAKTFFQTANLPVRVTGVGFFDFIHGQTGVAPNGIEIHPILDFKFTTPTTTSIGTSGTPSQYAQSVTFTIAVTNGGAAATATGSVGIFDNGVQIGTASLDPSGQATYTTDSLSVATHSISARYFGDGVNAPSSSTALTQVVDKADQTITFAALADKTYGAPPFTVSATGGGSSNPVTFAATGNCASSGTNGSTITISSGGSCTVTASQAGNGNYNAAPDVSRTFNINQADAIINVTGYTGVYDGQSHGATGTAKGVFGEDLSSLLDLGAKFTDVPGGTANWTFAGNINYAAKNGTANIVISKATPVFSNLSAPTINVGTASTAISGTLALGSLIPTGTVAITLNGVTQNAAIGVNDSFSSTFATGGLAVVSPAYTVSFSYGGDTNFAAASGGSTLTVTYVIVPLYDVTRSFAGKVVPIRLELTNVSGADLSAPSTVVNAVKVVEVSTSTSSDVQDAGNNTPDLDFRFDPTLGATGGYIFNLNVSTLSSGSYSLLFNVRGDPVQHSILFQIK